MLRAFIASLILAVTCIAQPPADPLIYVKMSTTAGDIILELNNEKAPISVANFLKYADAGSYNGTIFHRVIPFFVIQGGGYTTDLTELKGEPKIKNEWTNGLRNIRGTIAMARDADPDTATREFYINVNDNARLDTSRSTTGNAGYAVFGKVIAGMDVVDEIRDGVTGSRPNPDPEKAMDDLPTTPFSVTSVSRLTKEEAARLASAAKPGRSLWKLWRFDEAGDGTPNGFKPMQTGSGGTLATWRATKPADPIKPSSPPHSICAVATNTGHTYNLLLNSEWSARDVRLMVKVHADTGKEDRGGGLVWRVRDADNYYLARWNPLEASFAVFSVKGGKRKQIASADAPADSSEWHRIRIDHIGRTIQASFDGKTVINIEDGTLADSGGIGLWTKADAGTWFDDLAATSAPIDAAPQK